MPLIRQSLQRQAARPLANMSRSMAAKAGGGQLQRRRRGDGMMRQQDMFRDFGLDPFFDMLDPLFNGRTTHPAFELSNRLRSVPIDITEVRAWPWPAASACAEACLVQHGDVNVRRAHVCALSALM